MTRSLVSASGATLHKNPAAGSHMYLGMKLHESKVLSLQILFLVNVAHQCAHIKII